MAGTPARLFGPAQLTNAAATKITVPAGLAYDLTHFHLENPPGSTATSFTISVGADAAGTRIFDALALAAGATYDWYPNPLTLAAAEIIQAFADVTGKIVLTIEGFQRVV